MRPEVLLRKLDNTILVHFIVLLARSYSFNIDLPNLYGRYAAQWWIV